MTAAVAPAPLAGVAGHDGRDAWRVLGAAVVVQAVCVGTVASHGVTVGFLGPELGVTGGGAVLLVALATLLQFGLGPVAGILAEEKGSRAMVVAAAAIYGAGLVAASVASPPVVAVVLAATTTGVAGALVLTPLMASVSGWFRHRRLTAVAAMVTGNGAAAFLFAPLTSALVGAVGVRGAWAVFAGAGGAVVALAARYVEAAPDAGAPVAAVVAPRERLFAEVSFRRYYRAIVVSTMGALLPLSLLVPSSTAAGLTPSRAALVLGVAHLAGIASRIAVTFLVRPSTVWRHFRMTQVVLAGSFLVWAVAGGRPVVLALFAALYGASFGAWAALSPAVVVGAYGAEGLAVRMGALYTAPGIGGFVGPLLVTRLTGAPGDVTTAALLGGAAIAAGVALTPRLG